MKKLRSLYICNLMFLAAACGESVQKVPLAADSSSPPDSQNDAGPPTVTRLDATALAIGDPGIPGTVYGPKMGGNVSAPPGTLPQGVLGAAAAVDRPEGCHLFLIPDTSSLANFPRFYLSVVLPQVSWTEGIYRDQLRGRIEVDTHSGHTYKLDLDEALPGQFELAVEKVGFGSSPEGDIAYLTGVLRATVPPQAGTAGDPIELDFDINVPARRRQNSTN
jgi:hypothetical protein